MGAGDTFHYYAYSSDDNNLYSIKLSDAIASVGGFTPALAHPDDHPAWPFHERDLRHVTSIDPTTGKRYRLPLATVDNVIYVGTTRTYTEPATGNSVTVLGHLGERRPANHRK